MATSPPMIGGSDPSVLRSLETPTPSVARTSPPTVSATTGSATSGGTAVARGIAPQVSGDTTTYNQATQTASGTSLSITSATSNEPADVVTIYNTNKVISVSAVNQTVNSYKVNNYAGNEYSNNDVANFLPTFTGNVNAGNVNVTDTVYTYNLSSTGLASLTTLTVSATSNLGGVGNITITGGTAGQVLSTNGSGVLSWVSDATTYGNSNVANYLPTFTGNIGGNVITGNLFAGNGSSLSAIAGANVTGAVSFATTANAVAGANVTGAVTYATTANAVAGANVTGAVSFATTANAVAGANVSGAVSFATTANAVAGANVSGAVSFATTANSVAVANVSGIGNIATINLTGSTSNVLYGNGVFAPASGGGNANTGNVTFDNINIIGDGNLHLQPDPANAGAYLDIYLTAGPDIHISGGSGYSGAVILGTDEEANVAILPGGNVAIQAGNVDGTQTWTFDTDGVLTLPGGLTFPNDYYIGPGEGSLAILSPDSVAIFADQGDTDQLWLFGADGTTRFPTANIDLHNGGVQSGEVLQFGSNQQSIITGPTPSANVSAQRLIIQGQRGNGTGEGGDVYVWGGDSDTNGGDIKIYAGDADNVSAGSGGYVNLAGGDGFDNGGAIDITGGSSANGTGGAVYIDGGSGELDGGTVTIQAGYGVTGQGGTVQITGGASGNGTGSYGNVVLGSGSIQWIFDNTGNLTLPANTFAVNYANGTQVSIGSGGNTGNVTFDDQVVIGTGDGSTGSGGLYLAPGPDSTANLQYLRVRGGDVASHIHLDTGNSQYFDLYIGDDSRSVKIANTGNIDINTNDGSGNSAQWTFGTDGNITLPAGGDILVDNGKIISADGEDFIIIVQDSNDDGNRLDLVVTDGTDQATRVEVDIDGMQIHTNLLDVGNSHYWGFKSDGTTEFPDYTISQYSSLKIKSGNPSSSTAIWTFGDDGNLTLPDTTSVNANVNITLEANDTGNITGLNLIGDSNANLYAHGNVTIVSDSSNTTATWAFGTDGNLTLPGYLISTINDSLSATGNVQANAALLSKSYNIVTGSNVSPINGVILPTNPIVGTTISVAPRANTGDIKIYPQLGGTIEYGTVNNPIQIVANQPGNIIIFVATSSTNWISG